MWLFQAAVQVFLTLLAHGCILTRSHGVRELMWLIILIAKMHNYFIYSQRATAVSLKSLKTVSECYIWQAVFTFNTYTGCVLQKSVIQFFGAQKEHFRYQKGRCLSEKWCPFKCTAHSLSDILNCIFQIQNEHGLNLQWNYYLEKLPFWISKINF